MSQNRGQAHRRHCRVVPGPQGNQPVDRQKHGHGPFEGVAEKGKHPGVPPQKAKKVGGADIAAPGLAGIGPPHQPGHHQPRGD